MLPDWSGQVCAVVASGESVTREAVEALKGRCRVVVVNNGYEIAPWADLLYAADRGWWERYPGARKFAGIKCTDSRSPICGPDVMGVEIDPSQHRMLFDQAGKIGHAGNSGFQAINIAAQCKPRAMMWLGFDLCGRHWHDDHKEPLRNPRQAAMDTWRARLDSQASAFNERGIEIANCSPISRLTEYSKMSVDEAFERWAG